LEHFRVRAIFLLKGVVIMDERQTLLVLGWLIGSLIGAMFFLNAVALHAANGS
jgi:hypothetical protein